DHRGERAREALLVERLVRVALPRRAAEIHLDAAAPAAIALPQRQVLLLRQWKGVVAPLARDAVRPVHHAPVHDDAAADSGAEDRAEHDARALPGTVRRLGEREAVRVVGKPQLAPERLLEVLFQRPPDEPGGIRFLHPPAHPRERAGNADAYARRRLDLLFQI